jgi:hypothetical protein
MYNILCMNPVKILIQEKNSRLIIGALKWLKRIIMHKKKSRSIDNGVKITETEIVQNKMNFFNFCWTLTKLGLIIAFLIVCNQTEIFNEHPK